VNIVSVIPARMASSRFPGKPMQKIHGMPMIGHCYHRVSRCRLMNKTVVATCDNEVFEYIDSIGGKAVMTSSSHERASDRAAEAMLLIEKEQGEKIDILVMVQGDEPMDTPDMVEQATLPLLEDQSINVVNLMGEIQSVKEFEDLNTVKVVVGSDGNAMYFSREPIPSRRKGVEKVPMMKQICIIPFRRDFLLQFNETPETPLERIESVDMLRVLETGGKVKMVFTEGQSIGVDTPDHLEKVKKQMINDELMRCYL